MNPKFGQKQFNSGNQTDELMASLKAASVDCCVFKRINMINIVFFLLEVPQSAFVVEFQHKCV